MLRWIAVASLAPLAIGCQILSGHDDLRFGPTAGAFDDPSVDGSSDSSNVADSEADTGAGCREGDLFCAPFEGAYADGFTEYDNGTGCEGEYTAGAGVSGTRGFVATSIGSAACTHMLIHRQTAPTATGRLRIEFDVFLDDLPASDVALVWHKVRGTSGKGVNLWLDRGGLRINAGGAATSIAAPTGRWIRVALDAQIHTTEGAWELAIDGSVVGRADRLSTTASDAVEREVMLGISTLSALRARVRYDNLRLRWL
jgi:hypothetical protein